MAEKINVRSIALSLLSEYEELGKYVNLSLNSHKADRLTDSERAQLTALLYTVVEHKLTYDYYICALSGRSIDKIDPTTKNILRLGLCQLIDMSGIPTFAAVNETVKLARNSGERSFVNGILREADRRHGFLPLPDKNKNFARYLSVGYSFPLWVVKRYISVFGEEGAEELLRYFNSIPPTDLTVNTNKISREDYIKKLNDAGISASASEFSPISVRIEGSIDPRMLPGYSEGDFFVQDASCAAAVYILGAKQGGSLIDVCACPGGKSFTAAIMMQNEGRISAFDIHENKLSLVDSGAERLGLHVITALPRDARIPDKNLFASADGVICDAPCSGLGVLAKKPDLRYKREEDVVNLPELQYEILTASSKYLKSGGRMIYSTCTLLPEENGAVVERFLTENPDFHTVDFKIGVYSSSDGMFTFVPHIHKTDGFFVCLLEKDNL
ncbi:MAG: 16S rRNA (cytosine(967)-C(5))-methyltransferase RsmB [Ruminococcaceae bacterium]|nr:16S rRNA (cytosine(967)-C(5))-methyltransferase RsmB [Oscillospiraceae bacterium]